MNNPHPIYDTLLREQSRPQRPSASDGFSVWLVLCCVAVTLAAVVLTVLPS